MLRRDKCRKNSEFIELFAILRYVAEFSPASENPNLRKEDRAMKIKSNVKAGQSIWGA